MPATYPAFTDGTRQGVWKKPRVHGRNSRFEGGLPPTKSSPPGLRHSICTAVPLYVAFPMAHLFHRTTSVSIRIVDPRDYARSFGRNLLDDGISDIGVSPWISSDWRMTVF